MLLKILMQEEYTQTSSANSEHKHSDIERFSTLNERIITQNSKDSVIVNNLLMKLAGSTWGASANTLRSSALTLCYSAAEYCAQSGHALFT